MQKFTIVIATAISAAFSAAVLALAAPAAAVPTAGDNAASAISELESGQNRVIVDRLSDVPLSQAEVVSVLPGPEIRDTVTTQDPYELTNIRQRVPVGQVYYVTVR